MQTTELAGKALEPAQADARAELLARVVARIHRYFFRVSRDAADADDLTQTTLLRLQESLVDARYQRGRSFNTWMFMKAHSVYVDWCRRRERDAREVPSASGPVIDPATAACERLDAELVLAQLAETLGADTYETFVLRYESGLTLEEVAQAIGCTRRTVTRRLNRAHEWIDSVLVKESARDA